MTELTIDQALLQGVAAHKAGQVQEADRLYTAILKAQPKHPDANHNMGVLAVGVGKFQDALTFFKTALEARPASAQFWLSYIDTLIKLGKLTEAKVVLDQAKTNGAKSDGFDKLRQVLEEAHNEPVEASKISSKPQPNILDTVKLDQAIKLSKKKVKEGYTEEAKRIYRDILLKFPMNKRAIDGLRGLADVSVRKVSNVQDPPREQQQSLINLYRLGRLEQALQMAGNMVHRFPQSAILFNIQGAILKGLGQLDQSVEAYKKALAIKPDYADAHNNMGTTLKDQGRLEEAIEAYNKALAIKPDYTDAYYNKGNALKERGKWKESIEAYNEALEIKPDFAEVYYNKGVILQEQGEQEAAIETYKKALVLKPDYADAYNNMANALQAQGELEEAVEAYKNALVLKPDHADAYNNMGATLKGQGKLEEAIEAYNKALAIKPNYAEAFNNMGATLQDQGMLEEAIEAYKKALAIKPDYAEAHRHLSNLTQYKSDTAQISEVEALLLRTDLNQSDQCHLLYTHAKMQEDLGDLNAAFYSYVAGGELRQSLLAYDFRQDKHLFGRIKQTAPQFKDVVLNVTAEPTKHTPIFILGMPRSGTTLVEQIVSSHSEITGAGELPYVSQFAGQLAAGLTACNAATVSVFRERYLAELAKSADGRAFITDKMPQNFRYIAIICAAFPEAKIVHVQRSAEATCWSNFKHYFVSRGLGYSYSLTDTVKYYRLYKDMMHFWYQSYSDRIYNLDYEKLTENQEPETRRLIDYLGLNWQNVCLAPQKNMRSAKTASQQQIRQKVYKGSSQSWRKYELLLDGVFDELEA